MLYQTTGLRNNNSSTKPIVATASCNRCGRTLTNPKSIERGYGPVCFKKIGVPMTRKIKKRKVKRNLTNFLGNGTECAGGCGYILAMNEDLRKVFIERGQHYCAKYCCGCCPDAKISPCQKERISGGVLESLRRTQNDST